MTDKEKIEFKKAKEKVEEDLRNYPYWIISERLSGLGQPVKWGEIYSSSTSGTSSTESSVLENEFIMRKIQIIETVLDMIDKDSKKIIEETYFRDPNSTTEELSDSLKISCAKIFRLKKRSLEKFIVALRY